MKMLPHAHRASILAIFVIFTAALISGCKSYQLGNPTELPFDSIYIKPVTNDSFAPQAQALISSQIRDIFIHDGRTKLVTSSEAADAVLIVNLTEYNRRAAGRQSVDTTVAANFSLALAAEVSLFNQNKGDYYFQERMVRKIIQRLLECPLRHNRNNPVARFPTIGIPSHATPHPRLSASNCRRGAQPMGT